MRHPLSITRLLTAGSVLGSLLCSGVQQRSPIGTTPAVCGTMDVGQVYELPIAIADTMAESIILTDPHGQPISGTLLHPNTHRQGYGTEHDLGNKADYTFLPDREFSTVQLTFGPQTAVAEEPNGSKLCDIRALVDFKDSEGFKPLSRAEMGNATFLGAQRRHTFSGDVTLFPWYPCPKSVPPSSLCVKVIRTQGNFTGPIPEAKTRELYGWESDANYAMTFETEALPGEKQLVYQHTEDSNFHLRPYWNTEDDGNGGRRIVGDEQLVLTETIAGPRQVLPGTAKRAWAGLFATLWPVSEDECA